MGKKEDIEKELMPVRRQLQGRKSTPKDELKKLFEQMPVDYMQDAARIREYIVRNGLNLYDGLQLASWILTVDDCIRRVKVKKGVTFKMMDAAHDTMDAHFIVVRRANHYLHEGILTVCDLLEREKRMRFAVKRNYKAVDRCWKEYVQEWKLGTKKDGWLTLQDNLSIVYDRLLPQLEKVYEAVRDQMIRLGWRDVELKARCCVVLMLGREACDTFRQFFRHFWDETGCDFSACLAESDITPMVRQFARMCEALGFKICSGGHGIYTFEGIEPNVHVSHAWKIFMQAADNVNMLDDAARKAFEYNAAGNEAYQAVLQEEEQKAIEEQEARKKREMEEGFKALEEKYNVLRSL